MASAVSDPGKRPRDYEQLGRIGLRRLAGSAASPNRLFCFPFLGGQSLSFRPLAEALGDDFEVLAVDPPGHGWAGGAPLERAEPLLDAYRDALEPKFAERPYHVFGHSMGGLTGFRLTQTTPSAPRALMVSAAPLPHRVREYRYLARLSDDALFEKLDEVGTMRTSGLDQSKVFFDLVMPAVRADVSVLDGHGQGSSAPITVPLRVLYSQEDTFVPSRHMHEWRRYGHDVRFVVGRGHHLAVVSEPDVVAAFVTEVVRAT